MVMCFPHIFRSISAWCKLKFYGTLVSTVFEHARKNNVFIYYRIDGELKL